MADLEPGCVADKSAPTPTCYHVTMDQNLGRFPAFSLIELRQAVLKVEKGVQSSAYRVHSLM